MDWRAVIGTGSAAANFEPALYIAQMPRILVAALPFATLCVRVFSRRHDSRQALLKIAH